jgi:CheY-like chemotaxis protein/HPt (histidine-containing phosphotransfer) domain-containing protein
MTPAHGPEGEITGVYALMFDVTEQRQAAAALEQALAAAEAANTAKSEFLANMSHEIRTPMNAIIGLTTLALRTQSPVQQRDYIGKLQRSARDLLGLLNDILDFSKSEAGRLVIDPHPFVLNEVLGTLTDMFADAAKEKGLTFAIEVAPEVPQQLIGDAMRVKQVIANLCSNAIKFTATGGVQVAVAAGQQSDKRLLLKLSVTDTGVGMTTQQTQRIFDAFTQADGSTTRRFGGTGLGLTICRRLLDLMDGEISVESTPGQGSKFVVTLPLALAPAVNASHVRDAAGTSAGLRGARILVVDDYPLNQEIVQAYLTQAGCQVELASDGAEALLRLSQRDYNAVLMDCQMPVMDGYEATRQIRRNLRWKKLPVIAMTANVMQGDREKCLAAGMSDFLPKPVELEDLLAMLANWLERTRVSSAPVSAPVPVPAAESAPAVVPAVVPAAAASAASADFSALVNIDLEVALHATMGKPDFLRRILSVFFTSQSTFAARFAEARKSGDAEGATRLAHTLKGAAASIGAAAVRDAALTLERTCKQDFANEQIDALCEAVVEALDPVLAGIGCCLGLEGSQGDKQVL